MSKTDKENKENKERTDIINIANYNQDFSYYKTPYWSINHYSSDKTSNNNILTDIYEAKNKGFTMDYMVYIEYKQEKMERLSHKDKNELARIIFESIEQNVLQKKYDEYITLYKARVNSLKNSNTCINLKNIETIISHAESTSDNIFEDYETERQIIDKMDDNLIINLLLKKLSEIVIDTFFLFLSKDGGDVSNTNGVNNIELDSSRVNLIRRFARYLKAVPYIQWLVIAFDIGLLIWDYIKSTEGYTLAKEYTILKCFYTKVDNEASLVMLNHYMKRDDYYKVVSVYPPYHLGSYNYKEYTHNMSNILEDKLFAKVFDILLNINMQAYNTSLVNMKQENYVYLYENESRFAQLSFYSPSTTIEQSPYFNHIQNLFLKSSSFVFMQTSIYSSALVNEMLMASYLKKKAKINSNKYTVIISSSKDINDFRYKSQKYCFNAITHNQINSNVVCFYVCNKINIDIFIWNYNYKMNECIKNILRSYFEVKYNDYDSKQFDLVTRLVFKEIFNVDTYKYLHFKHKEQSYIIQFMAQQFLIRDSNNVLEQLAHIVTHYKTIHMTCKSDVDNQIAFEEINNFELYDDYPYYKKYLRSIMNFFEFIYDIELLIDNYYIPYKDDDLQKHINAYRQAKIKDLNKFFDNAPDDYSIVSCIKKDDTIRKICTQIINIEYDLDFASRQNEAKKNFDINENINRKEDFDKIISSFERFLIDIAPTIDDMESAIDDNKATELFNIFNTDVNKEEIELFLISNKFINEFVFKKLKQFLYKNIETKLPVSIIDIERIYGDKEYYYRICEYIYVQYFNKLYEKQDSSNKEKNTIEHISKKYLMSVSAHLLMQNLAVIVVDYISSLISELKKENINSLKKFLESNSEYEYFKSVALNVSDLFSKETIDNILLSAAIALIDDSLFMNNELSLKEEQDDENDNNDSIINNILKDVEEEDSFTKFALDSFVEKLKDKFNIAKQISEKFKIENIKENISQACTGIILILKLFNNTGKYQDFFIFIRAALNCIDLSGIPEFIWDNRRDLRRGNLVFLLNNRLFDTIDEDIKRDMIYYEIIRGNIRDTYDEVKAKIKQDIEEYKRYIVLKYKKLVASMRYMYYTVRVKCYPSDLSNSKYDKILLQYVKRSLRNLYDVDMDDIKVEYGRNPHFHYVIKIHGEVAYEYLDHANNHRNFIESYKTFISWYREQSISSSSSSNNNGTNGEPSLKRKITSGVGNIGLSFIAETAIDYMLPIIDRGDYERNKAVIKFVYTAKRIGTVGSIWNEDKDKRFFTLPLSISQNFIMSDFRAMVVGGAHFDNSCFIKGTSSGIFVQDNEKVTRSFLEIILDYIDVVEEQQLDVKMGKYLVAYYKVINYLYEFHNYYSMSSDKLNILYDNLSKIEEFINSNNLIQKKNGVDNENTQKINNNNSQYMDNLLMKDFVVQLKRIGESNYKFYETQKPAKKGQVSDNNNNSTDEGVQQEQTSLDNGTATDTTTIKSDNNSNVKFGDYKSSEKGDDEMPVLLGSLIYDESWFKSTIDDE